MLTVVVISVIYVRIVVVSSIRWVAWPRKTTLDDRPGSYLTSGFRAIRVPLLEYQQSEKNHGARPLYPRAAYSSSTIFNRPSPVHPHSSFLAKRTVF